MLVNTDVNVHRKKLNVPLIYNFYLCLAYLNRPSVLSLSGNKNPTTLQKTGQSVSQKVSHSQGPVFILFEHLCSQFYLKPKVFCLSTF